MYYIINLKRFQYIPNYCFSKYSRIKRPPTVTPFTVCQRSFLRQNYLFACYELSVKIYFVFCFFLENTHTTVEESKIRTKAKNKYESESEPVPTYISSLTVLLTTLFVELSLLVTTAAVTDAEDTIDVSFILEDSVDPSFDVPSVLLF